MGLLMIPITIVAILVVLIVIMEIQERCENSKPHQKSKKIFQILDRTQLVHTNVMGSFGESVERLNNVESILSKKSNEPVVKYILEQYKNSLEKANELLKETRNMEISSKEQVISEIAEMIKKFVEEIEEYEKTEQEIKTQLDENRVVELLKIAKQENTKIKSGKIKEIKSKI